MLKLLTRGTVRAPELPAKVATIAAGAKTDPLKSIATVNMATAEYHAFQAQIHEAKMDPLEARMHLGHAGEFLSQIGGPRWPSSSEEIYQWCSAKKAGEV